MVKRLIEVAIPLLDVSEESGKEKTIRHGHISILHMWWARRPLAACRAVILASLIPDPDSADCPESFRIAVDEILADRKYIPTTDDGSNAADTRRNRCLELIKHLVKWENSLDESHLQPARKLIQIAHELEHAPNGSAPRVLDPFSGGGAIPLEAQRLGCQAIAVELNPVAHLIQVCMLTLAPRFGTPDSRSVPEYIDHLAAHNSQKSGRTLFSETHKHSATEQRYPNVDVSPSDYKVNPLASDVRYWGTWVLDSAKEELAEFYPQEADGSDPVAYIWARTVKCPNPACGITIPLYRQSWLCKKSNRKIALRLEVDSHECKFDICEDGEIDFDPNKGTIQRGQASCPNCQTVANSKYLQAEGASGRIGHRMLAVMSAHSGRTGRNFRLANDDDTGVFGKAAEVLDRLKSTNPSLAPDEPLQAWSGVFNAPLFGMAKWSDLFNSRQLLALTNFVKQIQRAGERLREYHDQEYADAVVLILALTLDRLADLATSLCAYEPIAQCPRHLFGRQAIPMVWDYGEGVPPSERTCSWGKCLERTLDSLDNIWEVKGNPEVIQGTASGLPIDTGTIAAVITDPPYYDAVPYSDLSDFFYVWLKRTVGDTYPSLFRTPLTPKRQEIVSHLGKNYPGQRKTSRDYEDGMQTAFSEMQRVIVDDGICCVMFAHKTTSAWEALIAGLLAAGMNVTASWPIHTEMKSRLRGQGSAALASSVTLVCRKRTEDAGEGLWDDVRQELKQVAQERLEFFWNQGIRGADFFISAIGPSLSVYGRYARVIRLSGEAVDVGEFLDEVRGLVTSYALTKILHTSHTSTIDPESRFYVVWKWSYGEAKVPADESFKLAQALGMDTEEMWDKSGVLSKSGENVQAVTVEKRMKIKDLGEPESDGTPASLIDVLHGLCAYRQTGDNAGMEEFLVRSGQARNQSLWLVAQAVSEILPDGDKEKQLMQGLLNQKEGLEEATREGRLF